MRKLFASLVLCVSALTISAPAMPVRADTVPYEPEMIAHKVVAPTSPQTSGPSGLQSPYNRVPWGLDRIDQRGNTLDNSFSFSGNGAGVKVYIVDSGVNATHSEFGNRVVDGWSYRADTRATNRPQGMLQSDPLYYYNSIESYHNARSSNSISACASNPTIQQYSPSTFDDKVNIAGADITDKGTIDNDGHGTHVAGTIGGEFTGVAKGVTIVPVRVLDSCGSGTTSMVHNGLRWVLANHNDGEPAIMNMSIGFDSSASLIDSDIRALLAEGIVVVAAAGNEGSSSCGTTPAGTPGTISVGAVDSASKEAYYSNFGECVDIFAPGSDVISTWPKNTIVDTYYSETGTSMAAPHVSGAAALKLAALQQEGNVVSAATPGVIWEWLKFNSNCDAVTYYNQSLSASEQTPNRLLNASSIAGAPCKPNSVMATAGNKSASVTWTEPTTPNGSVTTGYTVTMSPGGASCSTNAVTFTCTVTNLTNNVVYTASVTATNAIGVGVAATSATVTPIGAPEQVANVSVAIASTSLQVTWTPSAGDGPGITYTATAMPGGASCTTTTTSCKIFGLKNGVAYTVSVSGTNTIGFASKPDAVIARPGFTVISTSVKKKSKTTLSKIVTSVSTGKKTWSETGLCYISAGKLVAPSRVATCKVTLKVAKSSKYPAMSTTVSVSVK